MFTGIDQASSRVIAYKLNQKFNKNKRKSNFKLSHSTVNTILNKELSKPRRAKKTFLITHKNKEDRMEFIKLVREKKIKGEDIFFTDESRFLLDTPLNPQTNQMRFTKEETQRYRDGDATLFEKLHKPIPKYTTGFMVAGGISSLGVGKLIFCVGTMDTVSYKRALDYFKQDIQRLNPNLYFQQDNASCHTSRIATDYISENFTNLLDKWPANSPDLSPIEVLWAILKEKLHERKHKTLDQLKKHLVFLWNRIPIGLCKKLVAKFDKKVHLVKDSGERINVIKVQKKRKAKLRTRWEKKWNVDNHDDEVERVVFSDKTLKINKERAIKAIKKEITAQKRIFKEINRTLLTDKQIKSLQKKYTTKAEGDDEFRRKKAEKIKHNGRLLTLNRKLDEVSEMSLNDWYNSLNNELRIKMIKFNPLRGKEFISSLETNDETNLEDEEEDNF